MPTGIFHKSSYAEFTEFQLPLLLSGYWMLNTLWQMKQSCSASGWIESSAQEPTLRESFLLAFLSAHHRTCEKPRDIKDGELPRRTHFVVRFFNVSNALHSCTPHKQPVTGQKYAPRHHWALEDIPSDTGSGHNHHVYPWPKQSIFSTHPHATAVTWRYNKVRQRSYSATGKSRTLEMTH